MVVRRRLSVASHLVLLLSFCITFPHSCSSRSHNPRRSTSTPLKTSTQPSVSLLSPANDDEDDDDNETDNNNDNLSSDVVDAHIERLIQSVDTRKDSRKNSPSIKVEEDESEEMDDDDDFSEDEDSDNEEDEDKQDVDEVDEDEEITDDEEATDDDEEEDDDQRYPTNNAREDNKSVQSGGENLQIPDEAIENESNTPSTNAKSLKDWDGAAVASSGESAIVGRQELRAPPNATMRWMMRQGRVGRSITLACILIWELLSLILPSDMMRALTSVFPQGRQPSLQHGRGKKRSRREDRKSADQAAFQQLQRAGRDARYAHVSSYFLQRHALGVFRQEAIEDEEPISVKGRQAGEGASYGIDTLNEETEIVKEEEDWVVTALQEAVQHDTVSTAVDQERRKTRKKIVQAAISHTNHRRPSPPARMNSSSSLLLGGLDKNRFSRNLFGAYPGDAVPASEAASPFGVTDLASRYGWGSWDEDDEDDAPAVSRRRKAKRGTRPGSSELSSSTSPWDEVDFLGSLMDEEPILNERNYQAHEKRDHWDNLDPARRRRSNSSVSRTRNR